MFLQSFERTGTVSDSHEAGIERQLSDFCRLDNSVSNQSLVNGHRRYTDGNDRIDIGVLDDMRKRLLELDAGGAGNEIKRIVYRRSRRQNRLDGADRLGRKFRQLHSSGDQGVGRENTGSPSIGDDRDAVAFRYRHLGQPIGDIKHFLDSINSDNAGLLEQRLNRNIQPRQRAGV
jgi:hypothetical protein